MLGVVCRAGRRGRGEETVGLLPQPSGALPTLSPAKSEMTASHRAAAATRFKTLLYVPMHKPCTPVACRPLPVIHRTVRVFAADLRALTALAFRLLLCCLCCLFLFGRYGNKANSAVARAAINGVMIRVGFRFLTLRVPLIFGSMLLYIVATKWLAPK
jgi:hypothetical protein